MSGFLAALSDAWTELRIHRGRVLLSLFGVAVAVAALTASVAFSDLLRKVNEEAMERSSGPPATISLQIWSETETQLDGALVTEAIEAAVERYNITYAAPQTNGNLSINSSVGTFDAQINVVGVDTMAIHRMTLTEGRWFEESDNDRLAPTIVVNKAFLDAIGRTMADHPTVTLANGTTAVIIGMTTDPQWDWGGQPIAFMLYDDFLGASAPEDAEWILPGYEMWVPLEQSDAVVAAFQRDLEREFPDAAVTVDRIDWRAYQGDYDPTEFTRIILLGISGIILLLGALSLLNITLVTVRQRVREIGIRRAFGATRVRIFFSVLMESVVATVLAGFAGILLAALIFKIPMVAEWMTMGLTGSLPPFPIEAAIAGLVVSAVVGLLAGLIPAVVAVRGKVIDAIRF
ncbi:ABC transporter permease [Humidisolicoccus flavus]|uniref:ABC transporter permease n=1 Tax=Humidisolicoccus flavus TaxID=3111414 RepID=UPI00324F380B